ncbi:MAG: TetR/AcrR family transcriptional regulator [Acidaminobacteraceae bacterium]
MTTKEKILYSAIKNFVNLGISQASLSIIAEDVDIKKSSIYYHFESKEVLVSSAIEMILNDIEYRINENLKSNANRVDDIEVVCKSIIEYHIDLSMHVNKNIKHTINISPLLSSASKLNTNLETKVNEYYYNLQKRIIQLLSDGQKSGYIITTLNTEITSLDIMSRIEGVLTLASTYKQTHITALSNSLYENIRLYTKSDDKRIAKKKRMLDYKSLDLARKW